MSVLAPIEELKTEFISRLGELCLFHDEIIDDDERADQVLMLLQVARDLAVVIDSQEGDPDDVLETMKKWLYCATSTLLFNKREINLQAEQKIEEKEVETPPVYDHLPLSTDNGEDA